MTKHDEDVFKRMDCIDRKVTLLTNEFHEYKQEWNPMLPMITSVSVATKSILLIGKSILWLGAIAAAFTAMHILYKGNLF